MSSKKRKRNIIEELKVSVENIKICVPNSPPCEICQTPVLKNVCQPAVQHCTAGCQTFDSQNYSLLSSSYPL
jgi:hypothetical protein